jgi:hypothetical protein
MYFSIPASKCVSESTPICSADKNFAASSSVRSISSLLRTYIVLYYFSIFRGLVVEIYLREVCFEKLVQKIYYFWLVMDAILKLQLMIDIDVIKNRIKNI